MAQIKLRIEMNQGRTGAPLDKFADVSRQLDRFLRALAADLQIPVKKGEWLALNFSNGSVKWDAALQYEVTDSSFRRFNETVEFITDYDPDVEGSNGLVTESTLLEYARIGTHIDPDEVISLGLYSTPASKKPKKWRQIGYRETAKVRQAIERPIEGYGAIQGYFHSWIIGGASPHFQLRELSTEALVRCSYAPTKYSEVVEALRDQLAVIMVSGPTKWDRAKKQVEELKVERIDRHERLNADDLASFFGSAPNLTGARNTSEYIDDMRRDG